METTPVNFSHTIRPQHPAVGVPPIKPAFVPSPATGHSVSRTAVSTTSPLLGVLTLSDYSFGTSHHNPSPFAEPCPPLGNTSKASL